MGCLIDFVFESRCLLSAASEPHWLLAGFFYPSNVRISSAMFSTHSWL